MFDILFSHIKEKVSLSDIDQEKVKMFFVPGRLRKRQYLLQEGEVCKNMAFVAKGLLRLYYVDDKGGEHMSAFGWEGWWLSDINSFLSGVPAVFNIENERKIQKLREFHSTNRGIRNANIYSH